VGPLPHEDVVLSGGCFQNRFLAERTLEALEASGRRVYLHGQIPPGDGGLAVGQLAVALARQTPGHDA
jgi:hydrogenase maturation protein HypF